MTDYEIREQRIMNAVQLKENDRVPFMPTLNNFLAYHYGVTTQSAMTDITSLRAPLLSYCKDYEPDLVYRPCFFPINALEKCELSTAKWPGTYHNLPEDTPYQYVDAEFLEDDDWDEYFEDPGLYLLTKVMPKKYKAFAGLSKLNLYGMNSYSVYGMASAGIPDVAKALRAMADTGEMVQAQLKQVNDLIQDVTDIGFPSFGNAVIPAPFDDFADSMRGLLTTCMDIVTDPDLIIRALDRWGDMSIPAGIANAKRNNAKYVFIPLHCGVDNFMSLANYEKIYWPTVKRTIMAIIDAGMTPIVFCEGNYYTRLNVIKDVPKGKVIYIFENVDLAEAKRVLGDVACISGGMPTQTLIRGNKEEIIETTKRAIDICAPGGGFIMGNSIFLDNVSKEAMETWKEATFKYGQY